MTSATDNQTTEQTAMKRFRTALEKRGIEFETNDDECAEGEERTTVFKANLGEGEFDIFVTAKDWYFDGKLTPWLDVEFHNALTPEQAIAATLGRGTLTAEQVREAIERHGNIMDNRLYEDWQAVADELNAELGSGTCEMTLIWTDYEDGECYECSACKGNTYTHGWTPNHCSNCGTKVKAVKR